MRCKALDSMTLHGDIKRKAAFTTVTHAVPGVIVVKVAFMLMSPCNMLIFNRLDIVVTV